MFYNRKCMEQKTGRIARIFENARKKNFPRQVIPGGGNSVVQHARINSSATPHSEGP